MTQNKEPVDGQKPTRPMRPAALAPSADVAIEMTAIKVPESERDSGIPWETFLGGHREWWTRVGANGPVYAVPDHVIRKLAEQTQTTGPEHRSRDPLLNPSEAAAEAAFWKACFAFGPSVVGVDDGGPILYRLPILRPPPPFPTPKAIAESGMFGEQSEHDLARKLSEAEQRLGGIRHQMLGYVGKLLFDQDLAEFREQRDSLELHRVQLITSVQNELGSASPGQRPPLEASLAIMRFPWNASDGDRPPRPRGTFEPGELVAMPANVEQFVNDRTAFMRRWEIARIVTWDLIEPQGPLEHIPSQAERTIVGPHKVTTTFPNFFDIPSRQDVRGQIRNSQRQAAVASGIQIQHPFVDTAARDGHPSQFENAYKLWFIESALRRRYGNPHGLRQRLVEAFAGLLGLSDERIQRIRQLYHRFLPIPA